MIPVAKKTTNPKLIGKTRDDLVLSPWSISIDRAGNSAAIVQTITTRSGSYLTKVKVTIGRMGDAKLADKAAEVLTAWEREHTQTSYALLRRDMPERAAMVLEALLAAGASRV